MTGQDVFFGCLGVAAIIVALATVNIFPAVLRMIERISQQERGVRPGWPPSAPPPPPSDGPPWGARPDE